MKPLYTLHYVHHLSYRRLFLCLFSICLLLIVAACGTDVGTGKGSSTPQPSPTHTATTPTPSATTPTPTPSATPGTSTSCPAPGTARAAVMSPLQLGTSANIVYFRNERHPDGSPLAVFYRYDVQTAGTTMIALEKSATIQDAQLSRDGQWILFTAQLGQQSAIQLVRIDGKDLQTLYCAESGTHIITRGLRGTTSPTQWSPDAEHLVFLQGTDLPSSKMLLLTLASDSLQTMPAFGPFQYQPRTWLDNARIYVSMGPVVPANMSILDTRNPAKGLQLAVGVGDTTWDFDSTYDATMLYTTRYDDSLRAAPGIFCQIEAQPATQTAGKLIFNSKTMLVVSVRVIGYGSSSLLLSVARITGDTSYNGLWKMNVDGTGLTRLTSTIGTLNQFTQYPWSNFSRDGKLYTVSNSYGSLSGGKLTQYAGSDAVLIGWTTA